jgi:GNAT superfamily N-acetyltransferase
MFMSYAKASARFGKTPGIAPGARFTLPKSPTSVLPLNPLTAMQRRQASVRVTPTKFHPTIPPIITPGHVEWLFNPEEIRRFEPLKSRLPADFWTQLLQVKDEQAAKGQPVTAGHAPDDENTLIYRAWRVDGSFGGEYLNLDVKAAPWFTPHGTDGTTFLIDLGDFDDDTLVLLFDILRQQPGWRYSAKGREGSPPHNLWDVDDWNYYMKNHVLPLGSPHCINFLVLCLERVAERLAPGNSVLLHLKQDLGYARQPQDVAAVLRAYFRVDEKRRPSLVSLPPTVKWPSTHIPPKPDAPPSKPPQTKAEQVSAHLADHGSDDDEEEFVATDGGGIWVPRDKVKSVKDVIQAEHAYAKATPNYKAAEMAFAGDPAVFEMIASQLIADGTVFAASFNKKEFLEWNNQTFRHIGEEMKRRPGKPVGVVLFHRNMYGDVTHISNFFVSAAGRVVIGHHESIDVGKAGMVDGLATGTVGCVSPTFYTLMLHNAVRKIFGLPPITEDQLPAMKSLAQTGTPTAHVIPIENFEAVEAFILRSASQSLTRFGLTVPYGVDPNPTLAKAAKDAAAGKLLTPLQARLLNAEKHFAIHPKSHPPGGSGPFTPGEASNNCARFELLCLQAAEAPGVAGMTYSAEMDLADVTECLFKAGALPNTDPEIIHLMRKGGYYKDPKTGLVTRHPLSFLALAFGWSLAPPNTPGTYPAHVDRVRMPEQDKLDAKLKESWSKVLATVQKNIDSFSTDVPAVHSALDIKKQPSPVQPVVTEADWHDVAAHVNALTKEEREKRFDFAETDAVMKSLRTARPNDQYFYVLRDPKSHAVTLLLQIKLSFDNHHLNMEVGTSVLADHRRKGLGHWGVAWAIAWGQNRGATYMRGHYDNTAAQQVENLLAKLNMPVSFGKARYEPTRKEYVMPLKPADHDSHWLEDFAQELQFNRNPPPQKK